MWHISCFSIKIFFQNGDIVDDNQVLSVAKSKPNQPFVNSKRLIGNSTVKSFSEKNEASNTFEKQFNAVISKQKITSVESPSKVFDYYTVRQGDTLSHIAVNILKSRGEKINHKSINQVVKDVAKENNIRNANLIFIGQRLNLNLRVAKNITQNAQVNHSSQFPNNTPYPLNNELANSPLDEKKENLSNAIRELRKVKNADLKKVTSTRFSSQSSVNKNHLLELTLERAVKKGFIPSEDLERVNAKIQAMSERYKFKPDDFARVTLMESDGLNPKATNGNCHGIIQFCDGVGRGAASIGLSHEPEKILDLEVLDQLDLVAQYFEDTGLKNHGPVSLDTLYLTILSPGARSVKGLNEPLPIAGPQASILHVGGSDNGPITKASIRRGLIQHAFTTLAKFSVSKFSEGQQPTSIALQANKALEQSR
ncbi:MAG: hypothetical protein CBC42_05535 [Betaproteobacteria bacterium TMED82]|nr:MAG: hypothetical protein CBC42_05535 [Betaproteobacteria bacterium TMED82]|tara:strand:- start:178669 stop:179940 length:1272 start_codon:yes stop_codon:yes gene_type:complete